MEFKEIVNLTNHDFKEIMSEMLIPASGSIARVDVKKKLFIVIQKGLVFLKLFMGKLLDWILKILMKKNYI
jgi:hypothetical protein